MQIEKKVLRPIDPAHFKRHFVDYAPVVDPHNAEYFSSIVAVFEQLAIGPNFWFVIDFERWINYACGGDIATLTPFSAAEFVGKSHSLLHNVTHPDDLPKVFAFSRIWIDYIATHNKKQLSEKNMSMYFRMTNAAGVYYWVMVQYLEPITDINGKVKYGTVFVTDISHIRQSGIPMMNIFDRGREVCQQFYCTDDNEMKNALRTMPHFTRREKQVLSLMAKGLSTKQIALQLQVSTKTVDNHRQHMLRTTKAGSSLEIVSMATRCGLI
jgi:DNA-binding CsgD family transcriptional regulator